MSVWRDKAQRRIAELTRDLPDSATVAERRKVLWTHYTSANAFADIETALTRSLHADRRHD